MKNLNRDLPIPTSQVRGFAPVWGARGVVDLGVDRSAARRDPGTGLGVGLGGGLANAEALKTGDLTGQGEKSFTRSISHARSV